MTHPTRRILAAWILGLSGIGVPAQADSVARAHSELSRARQEFSRALQASEDKSPAAVEALRKKYLEPVQQQVGKERAQEERKAIESRAKIKPPAARRGSEGKSSPGQGKSDGSRTTRMNSGVPGQRPRPLAQEPVGPSEPELVLDGSQVEKEIEFKKGEGHAVEPPLPSGGDGVTELEFDAAPRAPAARPADRK